VPSFIRWPGKIKPGTVLNGIVSHQDMLPTLLAIAGEPDINKKLLAGHQADGKTFKVHIDGVSMLPYLTGQVKESPRKSFFYMSDDGEVMAVRTGDWKLVVGEQRATSTGVWAEPLNKLRLPLIFNLRRDPFERAQHNSNVYYDWMISHAFLIYEMQALVAAQIENFTKFPPRQKPASFNLDEVMRQVTTHHQ
jgi:arylsulfatase